MVAAEPQGQGVHHPLMAGHQQAESVHVTVLSSSDKIILGWRSHPRFEGIDTRTPVRVGKSKAKLRTGKLNWNKTFRTCPLHLRTNRLEKTRVARTRMRRQGSP